MFVRRRLLMYALLAVFFVATFNIFSQLFYQQIKQNKIVPRSALTRTNIEESKETSIENESQERVAQRAVLPPTGFDSADYQASQDVDDLPVQVNPWIDLSERRNKTLEGISKYQNLTIGECKYKKFLNQTVYSKPEFMEEYTEFKSCFKSKSYWTEKRILAKTGSKGQLVLKTNFRYEVSPESCSEDQPPMMLYTVFSRVANFNERNSVRKTWGCHLAKDHRLIFVMGKSSSSSIITDKLKTELQLHKDILQTDLDEDEDDFGNKLLASMLAWVYAHCQLSRFVTKVTDKTFVNVKKHVMLAEQELYSANRIYGNLMTKMEPNRDPDSIHYISEIDWPWPYFPPFIQGPSFIISGDVVPRLMVAARFTPALPLEQVYFTGLVPLTNRIMRIGVAEFFSQQVPEYEDECSYAKYGAIEGVGSIDLMKTISESVEHVQVHKNITCTVKPTCLAKIDGKCMFYSKNKKTKG